MAGSERNDGQQSAGGGGSERAKQRVGQARPGRLAPVADARECDHRGYHPARSRPAALPARAPRLPAQRHPVRRRAVLRQRCPAGQRIDPVPRLPARAAAGDNPADDTVGTARQTGRHRLGDRQRTAADRGRGHGERDPGRTARPAPRPFRGPGGLRAARRLPGQYPGRAHGARRTVAGIVLPGGGAGCVPRRPVDGQPPAARLGRRRIQVRRRRGGVGRLPAGGPGRALVARAAAAGLLPGRGRPPGS